MLTNRKYTLLAVILTFVTYLGSTGQDVGCGDLWFDSGGQTGVYQNNEFNTTTFCPDVDGEIVTLTFNYVDIETSFSGCWDSIEIFDGPDSDSPSLGVFCGEESGDGGTAGAAATTLNIGDAFTATNDEGCLTVVFDSDGSVQETGWEALVSCGPPPDCTAPEASVTTERNCEDTNFDAVVTIDTPTPGGFPLLVVTATLDGVQLDGGTIANVEGQTLEITDLPLDSGVLISVDVLGASCTVTEVVNVSSMGCPIPITCGEGLEVSYCYDTNDNSIFLYESPDDEPVILYFESGLIETFGDVISIYDGVDNTGELLFTGNNGGDLTGLAVTANSGSLFLELETSGFGSCTSGSTTASVWDYVVGCGEFDIPGCTDPEALNFIPEATVDNGSCILPAVNDEPCGAVVLECNGAALTGNFDAASISEDIFPLSECGSTFSPAQGDLWFQFEADGTSTYFISAEEGPDMVVALYSGDDCGDLTQVEECSDFPESFTGTYEAGTYYFVVRPWSGSTFNNSYSVTLTCADGPPANDDPCGAVALECNADPINGNFIAGTSTIDDACFGTGIADVWYSFVSDGETAYSISETSFSNVVVGLYTAGECDGELTEVVGCQDFPENFNGVYEAGNYFVRIRPANAEQVFTLEFNCFEPPANDEICDAEPISCGEDAIGTTIGATFDEVGTCGTSNTAPGVWYEFTPDIDAIASFSTCNQADFDTKISVFTAASCDESLTCIDGLDDTFPDCTGNTTLLDDISVFSGQTYYVLVHGFSAAQGGFTLSVACEEVVLDCPGLGDFGDPCNDGDVATVDDVVTEDCECVGTPPPPGQVCGIPIDITSLPYVTTDNNTGTYLDDYESADVPAASDDAIITNGFLSTFYMNGPEVVYAYTPEEDQIIDVLVENMNTSVGLFIMTGCPFGETVGAHTVFSAPNREVEALPVTGGVTYYIVVATSFSATPYDLSVVLNTNDCEELGGDIGDACDDGDPLTTDDTITENCECIGTPTIPGQICGNTIEVESLPYITTDNTSFYVDDYGSTDIPPLAPGAINNGFSTFYFNGDDVVYEYTPEEDGLIDVNLNNHGTWAGLFVMTGCPFEATVGSHTAFDALGREIEELPVTAGTTYYIVISTFAAPQSTPYDLIINVAGTDCPDLDADFGDPCDDGDENTTDDVITVDCECEGTIPPPGQVCEAPLEVTDLPYESTSNTNLYGDDYETGDLPALAPDAINNGYSTLYFGGDDVVYSYTPEEDQFIDVTLSDHGTWVGLFVIEGCPFESTIGSQTGSDNLGRAIEGLSVTAGTTYYIVISTWPTPQNTAYTLNISVTGFDCPDLEADFGDPCDEGIEDIFGSTIQDDCTCGGGAPFDGCTSGFSFGARTISCDAPTQTIGGSWTNEYSPISGIADGLEYTFTSSEAEYFVTVTDNDGEDILASGQGEVVWTSDLSGSVRFYTHIDGACSTTSGGATSHTRSVNVNCDVEEGPGCEEAQPIVATPAFAGSLTSASIADVAASGEAQCVNAENPQADVWFSFESVTTNMYIRGWGLNDFDAAVEVYDSCGGELLNCQNDEPAGEREIVIISDLTVGETYYFRVYHAGDVAPTEQDFTVAVAHIPFTQLSDDDCGVFDYTPADMITTDLPVNQFLLTSWYFEFTELEAPFNTYEILSPNGANPNFMLQWFTQAEYGRTYEVRTRARMYQGPQWGDYGDACTIGFSADALTSKLIDEQALGFYNMCDVLEADNVPGATGYRWKFLDGINGQIVYDSPTRFCQLDLVEGLSLGSPYAVAIRVFTQGELSPQGELRLIAMNNFVPETQLDNAITDCGSTYDLNTVVSAVNICAAEFYTFKFTNISDANQADIFYTRDDGLRSINLTSVVGLIEGDTYSVQVLGGSGGLVGEYGPSCEITIAGEEDLIGEFDEVNSGLISEVVFEIYPNPTTGEEVIMNLRNLSQEQQEVMVEVYDLYGKKVHAEVLGNNGSQMTAVIQLPELASGIYTVNVIVNEERAGAQKLVVR